MANVGRSFIGEAAAGFQPAELELVLLVLHTALTPPASIQALPNDLLDVARTPSRSSPATSQTLPNIWRKSVTYVVPTPIPQWSA